jgi:hypothetical protein
MAAQISENRGMAGKGTDGRTRRRWSAARKAAIVGELHQPGATLSSVARRHALSPGRWRSDWPPQPGSVPPRFAEVIVDAEPPRDTSIEIETPGLGNIDPAWFLRMVQGAGRRNTVASPKGKSTTPTRSGGAAAAFARGRRGGENFDVGEDGGGLGIRTARTPNGAAVQ